MDLSIGQLSRLTGIPVKTIRYYSDLGLVPEARRTPAGYRHYDDAAFARLELVRALRDLGINLATIRSICKHRTSIEEVARANADALELHIRQLSLRRAVLRRIAAGASTQEEVHRMSAFAAASADECRRIVEEFVDTVFAGRLDDPFAERMRSALPVLANEPTDDQIDAWVELAGLVQDESFRDRVRQMASEGARLRAERGLSDTDIATQEAGAKVLDLAGAAVASHVDPTSPEASGVVDELVASFAVAADRNDSPQYRRELIQQLATFSDARVERYWQLLGIVNQWPAVPSMMPAYEWFMAALNARISHS